MEDENGNFIDMEWDYYDENLLYSDPIDNHICCSTMHKHGQYLYGDETPQSQVSFLSFSSHKSHLQT